MDWGKSIRLSRATGVERVVATDINPFKLERAGEVFRMMVGGDEAVKIIIYPHEHPQPR